MQTLDSTSPAGFAPKPLSSPIFIRCYRHYGEAKPAYDRLHVVAGIPEKQMTVALAGAAAGVVVASLRDRRRGVAQTGHVEPRHYDILVEEELAPQARDVLGAE